MTGPFGICRNPSDEPSHERKKEETRKSGPDDHASLSHTVDFREDITEDIRNRENNRPSIEGKRSDIDEFHAREIGDDEGGDEEARNNRKHERELKITNARITNSEYFEIERFFIRNFSGAPGGNRTHVSSFGGPCSSTILREHREEHSKKRRKGNETPSSC